MKKIFLILMAAFTLVSCAKEEVDELAKNLEGNTWEVTALSGQESFGTSYHGEAFQEKYSNNIDQNSFLYYFLKGGQLHFDAEGKGTYTAKGGSKNSFTWQSKDGKLVINLGTNGSVNKEGALTVSINTADKQVWDGALNYYKDYYCPNYGNYLETAEHRRQVHLELSRK